MVFTGAKLLVEHDHATDMVADHLAMVDEVAGILFFLNLLVDEPSQEVGGGTVTILVGNVAEIVDHGGHLLFMLEGVFKSL